MLIYGWGKTTKKDFGDTYPITCSNCGNETFLKLSRIKTWFTLFFIPIIPYRSKHYLSCKVCDRGFEVKRKLVKQAKDLNEQTKKFNNYEIGNEEYENLIKDSGLFS